MNTLLAGLAACWRPAHHSFLRPVACFHSAVSCFRMLFAEACRRSCEGQEDMLPQGRTLGPRGEAWRPEKGARDGEGRGNPCHQPTHLGGARPFLSPVHGALPRRSGSGGGV